MLFVFRGFRPLLFGLLLLLGFLGSELTAQTLSFTKGVNLTNWFQAPDAQSIPFSKFGRRDFAQIKSLGCDVIRLPINLHAMAGPAPDYTLDPLFLGLLDSAVNWAELLDLHLILDNHTFDPASITLPSVEEVLVKVWPQMATRYASRSNKVYYEILNEPHGIADATWGAIQGRVIQAIRAVDSVHTLIVGPAAFNSYYNLDQMPVYTDANLIYTFHFYDPFIFTHQGATWVGIPLEDLSNMPYPYDPDSMPALPPSLSNTWVSGAYQDYANIGTDSMIQTQLDIAIAFSQSRNVPVFCGEFGVYQPNSKESDRVRWYETVRTKLEAAGIPWTIWDYRGGFGVFQENTQELFDHHLNLPLLTALGLNTPPQTPFQPVPDSSGLPIYRDFVEAGIVNISYSSGPISFFTTDQPNYGNHHIRWEGAKQYEALAFDFQPDKDLSYLASQGYALDFFVRSQGTVRGSDLDVRFLDSKTSDPNDHPWRMGQRFNVGTGQWLHYHLPLSSLSELGSWDNNTWHNPQGLYDWSATERLEFVAELGDFTGSLDFDQIQLTELDTAQVNTTTQLVLSGDGPQGIIYPNPFQRQVQVRMLSPGSYDLRLYDVMGRLLKEVPFEQKLSMDLGDFPKGVYRVLVRDKSGTQLDGQLVKP